jgi:hypothetical protein
MTTPKAGQHIHLAEHMAMNRITFTRAYLPRNFPIWVTFLWQFQHAYVQGFKGQVTRWLLRLDDMSPGTFAQWQIALALSEYIFEDFENALTMVAQ